LDFISSFALPFLDCGFVDAVKQNNHFSQILVACNNACLLVIFLRPTTKLCGANEAQRSLCPNERLVMRFYL